jgi:hypothetical protein
MVQDYHAADCECHAWTAATQKQDGKLKRPAVGGVYVIGLIGDFCAHGEILRAVACSRNINDINAPNDGGTAYSRRKPSLACVALV